MELTDQHITQIRLTLPTAMQDVDLGQGTQGRALVECGYQFGKRFNVADAIRKEQVDAIFAHLRQNCGIDVQWLEGGTVQVDTPMTLRDVEAMLLALGFTEFSMTYTGDAWQLTARKDGRALASKRGEANEPLDRLVATLLQEATGLAEGKPDGHA